MPKHIDVLHCMHEHTFISPYSRKVKNKVWNIFKKQIKWLLLDFKCLTGVIEIFLGFFAMLMRPQVCSEAGLSFFGAGRDLHQLMWGWPAFQMRSLFMFLYLYFLFGFTLAVFLPIIFFVVSPLVSPIALSVPTGTNLACSTEVCWLQTLETASCLPWINRSFLSL